MKQINELSANVSKLGVVSQSAACGKPVSVSDVSNAARCLRDIIADYMTAPVKNEKWLRIVPLLWEAQSLARNFLKDFEGLLIASCSVGLSLVIFSEDKHLQHFIFVDRQEGRFLQSSAPKLRGTPSTDEVGTESA